MNCLADVVIQAHVGQYRISRWQLGCFRSQFVRLQLDVTSSNFETVFKTVKQIHQEIVFVLCGLTMVSGRGGGVKRGLALTARAAPGGGGMFQNIHRFNNRHHRQRRKSRSS